MNENLQDLYDAFQLVNSRYYFTEVYRMVNRLYFIPEAVNQSTENSFSAELFRHWRNIMESENKIIQYNGLALDFDIRKELFDDIIVTNSSNSFRPDLVLHLSQLNWDPNFQKVYIEVKTNCIPYVKDDIQKLANAISVLRFERAVFISVNSNYTDLVRRIRRIVISENNRLNRQNIHIEWDKIFLFHSIIENNRPQFSEPITFLNIIQ